MKILILGGTRFVGRALAQRALTEGHDLTLFHRNPTDLFPEARHLLGDRNEGHSALAGESFDAAIDVSAYVPRIAGDAARTIRANHYVFVSTISVYSPPVAAEADETHPLLPAVRDTEEVNGDTYGGLKVACEEEVRAARADAAVVRPGVVGGAHDPTNRLAYYVRRFRLGGAMLIPPRPEQPIQIVDARDLAGFMLHLAINGTSGEFNAVGPEVYLRDLWSIGQEISPGIQYVPLSDEQANPQGIEFGRDLPLYASADQQGMFQMSAFRAEAQGFIRRPFRETVFETDAWLQADDPGVGSAKYGQLTPAREAEVIARLR